MSSTPETLLAVLGRKKPAGNVAARDFAQPRRLAPERASALGRTLKNALPALEKRLLETAGLRVGLALEGVGEVDAETLFARPGEPLCVLRFRCAKAPAWLVWDPASAVRAVEAAFGARGSAGAARRLSHSETRVATQLLSEIARGVTAALGLAAGDFALVQVPAELGSWREGGSEASPHRVEVRLALARGEDASSMRLHLPGIDCGAEPVQASLPAALPGHLEKVEVELSACLPGREISLDQLLALEEGDVIPLDARVGDPTRLCVEGLTLAHARLGSHRGRLAVRIERVVVQPDPAA